MQNRLNRNQVAERLAICPASVRNFVRRGDLPEPIFVGRKAWWPAEIVEQVARFGTAKSQPQQPGV